MKKTNTIPSNPLIDALPVRLKQYIKPQCYGEYTAVDQAVWRYVMRKNLVTLRPIAHHSYLDGLKQTGISIENIPNMYGMNRILKEIGWAAVAVDGFIPPNAFMEFQAYNILVIAADIRQLEHIEYTPAPDIIHEAAGHAPIIANPKYAEYLRRFGAIGSKAIASKRDHDMYEAVRLLSIQKEHPGTDPKEIEATTQRITILRAQQDQPSEMSLLRNLHWWTVEYGLIGRMNNPKIYGAGLLSSIGESEWCMSDEVIKKPYTLEAAQQHFDITKPQPQLFVTPNFDYLLEVLDAFVNTMALRTGGVEGVQKLIASERLGTVVLNTGIEISGIFTKIQVDNDRIVYAIQTEGKTALAYNHAAIKGHSVARYPEGLVIPLGRVIDLESYLKTKKEGDDIQLKYENGIRISGRFHTVVRDVTGNLLIVCCTACEVRYQNKVLCSSKTTSVLSICIGQSIISAYAGPADFSSFISKPYAPASTTIKKEYNATQKELHTLYESVRNVREGKHTTFSLEAVFEILTQHHKEDWLLAVELYELVHKTDVDFATQVLAHLDTIKLKRPEVSHLIDSGIQIAKSLSI